MFAWIDSARELAREGESSSHWHERSINLIATAHASNGAASTKTADTPETKQQQQQQQQQQQPPPVVDAVDEEEFDEEEFITEDAPRRPSFRPLVNKQQQQQQRPRADASNDPAASATTAAATAASSKSNNGAAGDAANAKAAADLPPVSFLPHDLTLEYIYGSFLVAYAIWFWLGRRNNQNLAQAWYTIRSRSIHPSISRDRDTNQLLSVCLSHRFEEFGPMLTTQFHRVTLLSKESQSSFYLLASGRLFCKGLKATIDVRCFARSLSSRRLCCQSNDNDADDDTDDALDGIRQLARRHDLASWVWGWVSGGPEDTLV